LKTDRLNLIENDNDNDSDDDDDHDDDNNNNKPGTHDNKSGHIEHCAGTYESTNVEAQNVYHGK
jgi:hypothetical protein